MDLKSVNHICRRSKDSLLQKTWRYENNNRDNNCNHALGHTEKRVQIFFTFVLFHFIEAFLLLFSVQFHHGLKINPVVDLEVLSSWNRNGTSSAEGCYYNKWRFTRTTYNSGSYCKWYIETDRPKLSPFWSVAGRANCTDLAPVQVRAQWRKWAGQELVS